MRFYPNPAISGLLSGFSCERNVSAYHSKRNAIHGQSSTCRWEAVGVLMKGRGKIL